MLTSEQILALSPDDGSAKAAKGLLAPGKWPTLGHDEGAIWGECQGSGSKPYQVIIDVGGPSFKCSCPSRKFPCKHGLALYLLLAQKASSFTANTRPAWVEEWMAARQQRAEKQAEKKAVPADAKPADPAAVAKRETKRLDRMITGARDLERWMADLVRHGISDLPTKPLTFWREAAARLVDAQAGGLAVMTRQLETAVSSGDGWQQRALVQMGRMQLLTEAMQRLDSLPEALRQDVRSSAGWAADKDEVVAANDRVEDVWQVLGVSHDENEKLWERRVWLRGIHSAQQALLLDFSHGGRRFDHVFVPGMKVKAALAFFPSACPLRALLIDAPVEDKSSAQAAVVETWDEALDSVAEMLGRQPWLQRLPVTLHHAIPVLRNGHWQARDAAAREAPLKINDDDAWQLLALSGGRPLTMFGEWLGDRWRPLSAWQQNESTPSWTEVVALT
ncbi:MAG TPA: SWIM zinc finger family protein [Prosthecobacter sp.]